MKSTTTTNNAYKVSEQTAAYIGCLNELSKLYEQITAAMELHYGSHPTEQFEADFSPAFEQLRGVIHKYIAASIDEQIGFDNTTI